MSRVLLASVALTAALSLITAALYTALPLPDGWATMLVAPVAAIVLTYGLMPFTRRRAEATVPARRQQTPRSMNG